MSTRTNTTVHQYDCIVDAQPKCEPPCSSIFHKECLSHFKLQGERYMKADTLKAHLRQNGHANATQGTLLLKADVEGAEWEIFSRLSLRDLRKFHQVVMELHDPCVFASRHDGKYVARLRSGARASKQFVLELWILQLCGSDVC